MDLSTITAILALFLIAMVIFMLLTRNKEPKQPIDIASAYPHVEELVKQAFIAGTNEVKIVKMVREQTGAGLLDAKLYVDKVKATIQ